MPRSTTGLPDPSARRRAPAPVRSVRAALIALVAAAVPPIASRTAGSDEIPAALSHPADTSARPAPAGSAASGPLVEAVRGVDAAALTLLARVCRDRKSVV